MEKYLSIGSVVKLKQTEDVLFMLTGLMVKNQKDEVRDYVAVRYPLGTMGDSHYFFFNHSEISEIVHEGYVNEDHLSYVRLIEEIKKQNLSNTEE